MPRFALNRTFGAVLLLALAVAPRAARADLRIGMLDLVSVRNAGRHNAAAVSFARTRGQVTQLQPDPSGGWRDATGRIYAPEEFDVLWCHEGDDPAALAAFSPAAKSDLGHYLQFGGTLLLSGAAGALVNTLGIEPTSLRVYPPTGEVYLTGLVVPVERRSHPAFAGLDVSKPVLLTSGGLNAFADFYGTEGPHGDLLAEGNTGVGERPLVEYKIGAGRVIVVGWRLADFTTDKDAHRPNLERLFTNLLGYLAEQNTNRARLAVPAGPSNYKRMSGIPFLIADSPRSLSLAITNEKTVARIPPPSATSPGPAADGGGIVETRPTPGEITVEALGLTALSREQAATQFVRWQERIRTEKEQRDRAEIGNLKVITPHVTTMPAPIRPTRVPDVEQSVLLGHSVFHPPAPVKAAITPVYEPLEDGGFRIAGGKRQLNRMIGCGQNRLWTGDVPIFRMDTDTGNACYSSDRIFPLWPRPDSQAGAASPCMGTLRISAAGVSGKPVWLDEAAGVTATFRPGYTTYDILDPAIGPRVTVLVAATAGGHGMVCRIEADRDLTFAWQYGGIWWLTNEHGGNKVEIAAGIARITEPNLPNGLVTVGCDAPGELHAMPGERGQSVEFKTPQPRRTIHVVATWGVTAYDDARAAKTVARLDTPASADWSAVREKLKTQWFDCFIRDALQPEQRLAKVLHDPSSHLTHQRDAWADRLREFQVHTPDRHFDALVNWERCRSAYYRKGPGLYLSELWQMYSHISTGWYGKEWSGDHDSLADCLRLYGAFQRGDGFIPWISPSLVAFGSENNTPYWVDHVYWHYAWTADRDFVHDLWPIVRKAVDCQCRKNDPDGDGLFQDWYEYWNCDSNGKGPKAAAATAMSWAMLDRAARLAVVVNDGAAAEEYRRRADRTRDQVMGQLWRQEAGRLGSIGADDIWRGHGQTWEQYLAINAGLLGPDRGRSAMRWIESHYGFEPLPGVHLLACSDWWPIRWSTQWIPTGDTLLAAMAGMKCGDADLWWPYVRTVVGSAFQSEFPGINMGISTMGAGGGDREDVDSTDPHVHMTVRGLFGIEPAVPEGRIDICPGFPSNWTDASIRMPDISYTYHREAGCATFRIHTEHALVKRVRAHVGAPDAVTPAETDSVVSVDESPLPGPASRPAVPPPIIAEQQPPTPAERGRALEPAECDRQVLFDLSAACNVTTEELTSSTPFLYDCDGSISSTGIRQGGTPSPITSWWGNPALSMPPGPRVIEVPATGVKFLTAGRPQPRWDAPLPKNLLALSSWQPYPLPAGAIIPVNMRCERLWLLLQNYVHPMKNYIPNAEIVLHYGSGDQAIMQLIPPLNLDCYFQPFSRQGISVPLGRLGSFEYLEPSLSRAQASALEVGCDATRTLDRIELRAVCSEGVLGVAGLTVLPAAQP